MRGRGKWHCRGEGGVEGEGGSQGSGCPQATDPEHVKQCHQTTPTQGQRKPTARENMIVRALWGTGAHGAGLGGLGGTGYDQEVIVPGDGALKQTGTGQLLPPRAGPRPDTRATVSPTTRPSFLKTCGAACPNQGAWAPNSRAR